MKIRLDDKRLAIKGCFHIGDSVDAGTPRIGRSVSWKKPRQAVAADEVSDSKTAGILETISKRWRREWYLGPSNSYSPIHLK
jgi:hypothetical protein